MIPPLTSAPGLEQSVASPSSPAPSAAAAPEATPPEERRERFRSALEGWGREIDRGEALVRSSLGGGAHLGAGELIALQAGIYRYSEAVDLAAKLVDRAASAVKTTLQGSGS